MTSAYSTRLLILIQTGHNSGLRSVLRKHYGAYPQFKPEPHNPLTGARTIRRKRMIHECS